MTKREIFKRLQNIRDYARVTDTWPHDNAEQQNLHLRDAVEAIAKDLGDLLLDLAAPEEKPETETPKAEEKRPPIIIYKENGPKRKCPYCGTWSFFDTVDNSFYCENCEGHFGKYSYPAIEEPKRETPEAEEKHPGIIVDPSGKNPPHCLKCGGKAKTHHNLFAAGDEWVMCEKCIAMFRVKPKRGEGEK